MILYHYEMSPYAEKVRAMFGYTNTSWQSVLVPPMPPRKGLDALTGGYRRIPVAQQGADLFCDTGIICDEIAAQHNNQDLSLYSCDEAVAEYSRRIEREYFFASVASVPSKVLLKKLLKHHSIITGLKLVRDRAKMRKASSVRMPGAARSVKLFNEQLHALEEKLEHAFLFGEHPTFADFSAYHHLWFYHELGAQPLPDGLRQVSAWFERMHAFGRGERDEKPMRYALAQASQHEPRVIDEAMQSPNVGRDITIQPNDYAQDSVSGRLVGEGPNRWIIARDTAQYGNVHVHFPKEGYAAAL